ncbi:hypothetical protein M501DRAFT_1016493 [Patellaria atrata CBS 101060]|uniref:Protein kinase domain-containing protein n=1 Tax=Patellaria atrata CBS 101060 TaxID=1346257 RepID=A0A9P4SB63_9PEZI|nr:hypothetical protein M501DRAFT_1016493 [Patellaria atrata CBS 101060]
MFGVSGKRYDFMQKIRQETDLYSSGEKLFILKYIPAPKWFRFNSSMLPLLSQTQHIRLPCDNILGLSVLVYQYFTIDLLGLVQRQIPRKAAKKVLKTCLQGISELHEREIAHLDIKPENIVVNCRYDGSELVIDQVQITDLENAAHLPGAWFIKDEPVGSDNWRSPETYFKAGITKSTDISFIRSRGAQSDHPSLIRLKLQAAYFGDADGLKGLMKHIQYSLDDVTALANYL